MTIVTAPYPKCWGVRTGFIPPETCPAASSTLQRLGATAVRHQHGIAQAATDGAAPVDGKMENQWIYSGFMGIMMDL